jgi:hypothetical protein
MNERATPLFDLSAEPEEKNNLAGDPRSAKTLLKCEPSFSVCATPGMIVITLLARRSGAG